MQLGDTHELARTVAKQAAASTILRPVERKENIRPDLGDAANR
jgi:hypothetical protein